MFIYEFSVTIYVYELEYYYFYWLTYDQAVVFKLL